MGMNVGSGEDEEEAISAINTTPLVDVMLVLLIIFLITVPVITKTIPVELPDAANIPTETKPENITVAIDKDGKIYWNLVEMTSSDALLEAAKAVAVLTPQPEVHIRGDLASRYESIGRVVVACQRAGIAKVGFITEPPAGAQ